MLEASVRASCSPRELFAVLEAARQRLEELDFWVTRLPSELWAVVFEYLDLADLVALRQTCRSLRAMLDDDKPWLSLARGAFWEETADEKVGARAFCLWHYKRLCSFTTMTEKPRFVDTPLPLPEGLSDLYRPHVLLDYSERLSTMTLMLGSAMATLMTTPEGIVAGSTFRHEMNRQGHAFAVNEELGLCTALFGTYVIEEG